MMKKPVLISITLLFVMILPIFLKAQGIPDDPNDVMVPLDGGLAILLGAAAAYGSHKIKERRKGKKV
jgi:hypothetical protein